MFDPILSALIRFYPRERIWTLPMRTVGLITEYNPFHNGHLHHLRESKRAADAEVAVAVMSGHFLQRGEPALADKWVRAEMALAAGVDVVVELPFPWACNSAPHFALGAVQALNALGSVDALCFGSEAGEIGILQRCADLLLEREGEVAGRTAGLLREGVNYPAARARSVAGIDEEIAAAFETPNNILGIEYLKALRRTASPTAPLTIPRIGAGYHDRQASGEIASATGIRAMLAAGRDPMPYMPEECRPQLHRAIDGRRVSDSGRVHLLLLAAIFRGREALQKIYQVEYGIENRLPEAAAESGSWESLVDAVKSRHFTRTRIQRLLMYVLNDVTREDIQAFLETGPLYLHLLGCSERGRAFLAACRKKATLPIVSNYSRIYPLLKRFHGADSEAYHLAQKQLELELRATRNYTLLMKSWTGNRNRDFFEQVRRRA
jgi:predicted nucleotidyltransferase